MNNRIVNWYLEQRPSELLAGKSAEAWFFNMIKRQRARYYMKLLKR